MTSVPIQILLSAATILIVYAFVCQVRLTSRAEKLGKWVAEVRPELWAALNPVARSWGGGHGGLKLLHRRRTVGLPEFDRRFEPLRELERRLLWGVGLGGVCLGLVAAGTRFWGWHF